jgi:hypothetical protein
MERGSIYDVAVDLRVRLARLTLYVRSFFTVSTDIRPVLLTFSSGVP